MAKGTKKTGRSTQTNTLVTTRISQRIWAKISTAWRSMAARYRAFLGRRPHRSFQRTRRRDYVRALPLPGYISLTTHTLHVLKKHRRTMILLVVVYALIIIAVGGITNQDTYGQIKDLLVSSSGDLFNGGWGQIGQAGLLASAAFAGLPANLTADQQIYLGIALVFAWLSTVWLLREYLLGRLPKLRDGLYNSGAPFLSTVIVLAVIGLQLIPVGIVAVIYAGFASVGLVDGGFSSMAFWVFAALVSTLSLYWITSSLFALVIVTLPGMYPLRALRMAGDIVIGRRLRVLYRLLWGLVAVILLWSLVIVVAILLNSLLTSWWPALDAVPLVPYIGALTTAAATVLYAAYVYLFYREVVDNV